MAGSRGVIFLNRRSLHQALWRAGRIYSKFGWRRFMESDLEDKVDKVKIQIRIFKWE